MICEKCRNTLPEDSRFCPYCGNRITLVQEKRAGDRSENNYQQSPESRNARYCPRCGGRIERRMGRCMECGRRRFRFLPLLLSLLFLVVIVCLGYGYTTFWKPEQEYQTAIQLRDAGEFDEANEIFERISGYKNSNDLIHKHYYSQKEYVAPTCQQEGYCVLGCDCGKQKKDYIAPSHKASSATCTTPSVCEDCGKVLVPALGHDYSYAFCPRCGLCLFETAVYSGKGAGCITGLNLPAGLYNVVFTHDGQGNFIAEGSNENIWVNEIGKVSYVCQIHSLDGHPITNGFINIRSADGSWTVTIEAVKD